MSSRYQSTYHSPSSSSPSNSQISSSSYIIYRNYKYYGVVKRVFHYSLILIRHYIHEPISRRLRQIQNYLLELCGFICLIFLIPVLICTGLVLYASRLTRTYLIRRFYPKLTICEDFSLRSVFNHNSSRIITSIVWINGKLTAQDLQLKYSKTKIPIMEQCIGSKFGVQIHIDTMSNSEPPMSFNMSNHITETPSIYHNPSGKDDEYHKAGQKSKLQKLIGDVCSKRFDNARPQWEIVLIPLLIPQRNQTQAKLKTCCVLRFHYIYLNNSKVHRFLGDLFNVDRGSPEFSEDPLISLQNCVQNFKQNFRSWFRKNLLISSDDLKSWWILQRKKSQYYSTARYLKILLYHQTLYNVKKILNFPIECCGNYLCRESWNQIWSLVKTVGLLLRSLSYIPIELISCCMQRIHSCSSNSDSYGFSMAENVGTREITWSALLNQELLGAIQDKTGCSVESVILGAISIGLNQYYIDMSLPNPGTIGISIPVPTLSSKPNLLSSNEFKSISLATNCRNLYGNEIDIIRSNLTGYPPWKVFGTSYLLTFISHFVPRCIASRILTKVYRKHPINFTFINLNGSRPETYEQGSPFSARIPTLSLWGCPVDECTFWTSPQSNSCISISLVNYCETMRLVVSFLTPLRTLASSLTRHLDLHLNHVAEIVGVEKSKIPYSKKSSPNSTPYSSPKQAQQVVI